MPEVPTRDGEGINTGHARKFLPAAREGLWI